MSLGSSHEAETSERGPLLGLLSSAWKIPLGGGGIALVDQAVVSAANFFTNVTVGKSCALDELGVYTLAISLLYFCRGFQEQLVASPYTVYRQYKTDSERPLYAGSSLIHQIATSLGTFVLIVALTLSLRQVDGNDRLVRALSVMLIAYPFFMFREFFRKVAFAHFHFKTALIMDGLVFLLQVGLCALLWYLARMDSGIVFVVIGLASIVACAYWLTRRQISIKFDHRQFAADWVANWNFSRWALLTFLLGCSTPFLMPWFIAWIKDRETSALFFACATLVGLANMVLNGINNLLGPTAAKAYASSGKSALWSTLANANFAFLVLLVPFCVVVWATSRWLPVLILQDASPDLRAPLVLLSVNLLFGALGTVAGNGLWAIDCPRLNIFADCGLLLTTFGMAYFLIPSYSVTGAALSVLTGTLVACAIRWSVFVTQVGWPSTATD